MERDGLDDEQLRRPMTPSGTNLLGLTKHLAAVEYGWFCHTFGRETEPLPFDEDDENADLRVIPEETTADIVAFYSRARAAADKVIHELDLDDVGTAELVGSRSSISRRDSFWAWSSGSV